MNNREICRFVNSKDIRQHLLDINYNFTTVEASWLVCQCRNITLQGKVAAWEEIIATMPDQVVDTFHSKQPSKSIHTILRDYIKMKKIMLEMFRQKSPDAFYQYIVAYGDYDNNYDDSPVYSSLEKCLNQLKKELKDIDEDEIGHLSIRRSEIDGTFSITAHFSLTAEITDLELNFDYGVFDWHLMCFFDNLCFRFPTPFKKGDILYDPHNLRQGFCGGPIVMTGITPLNAEENVHSHIDSSDMNIWGYFQDDKTGTVYQEVTWNYMDYEYFPKEHLTGKKRILKALSNLLKGEIDLDLFIKAYHMIILEESKKDLMSKCWFTDEGMELAGLRS